MNNFRNQRPVWSPKAPQPAPAQGKSPFGPPVGPGFGGGIPPGVSPAVQDQRQFDEWSRQPQQPQQPGAPPPWAISPPQMPHPPSTPNPDMQRVTDAYGAHMNRGAAPSPIPDYRGAIPQPPQGSVDPRVVDMVGDYQRRQQPPTVDPAIIDMVGNQRQSDQNTRQIGDLIDNQRRQAPKGPSFGPPSAGAPAPPQRPSPPPPSPPMPPTRPSDPYKPPQAGQSKSAEMEQFQADGNFDALLRALVARIKKSRGRR